MADAAEEGQVKVHAEDEVETTAAADTASDGDSDSKKRPSSSFDVEGGSAEAAKRQAVDGQTADAPAAPIAEEGEPATGGETAAATEPEQVVRAIIPSKIAGSLIGRRGDTISYIRQQSQAKVNISDQPPDRSVDERVLTVTGTTTGVFRAFSFICDRMREVTASENPTVDPTQQGVAIKILVPDSQAGAIIGKKGAKIKEIRDATNAKIDLGQECLFQSTERPCAISGTAEACAQTVFHVACTMLQTPEKGASHPYVPGAASMGAGGMGGGGGGGPQGAGMYQQHGGHPGQHQGQHPGYQQQHRGGYPQQGYQQQQRPGYPQQGYQQQQNQPSQHSIAIPTQIIGAIIGRGGTKIKEIRQMSQAQIKIAENLPGQTERTITMTGTPEGVQTALYMIQQRMQRGDGDGCTKSVEGRKAIDAT